MLPRQRGLRYLRPRMHLFFFLMPGGHPFGDQQNDKKNMREGTAMNINRKCTLVIYRCRPLPPFMIFLYL